MASYAEQILNLINNSSSHMTAEQIFFELKKRENKIVLATVYNNLNALYSQNLIRKVTCEGSPDRYDKILKHDHVICKKCGKLSDFCFDDMTLRLQSKLNSEIINYDLKVYYICPECRKKELTK